MKHVFKFLPAILFLIVGLCATKCGKQPVQPKNSQQWFCKTIADLPTQSDTENGADSRFRAVAYKGKAWPNGYKFRVGFMGGTSSEIGMFKQAAVKWTQTANVLFEYPTSGPYDIRVTFHEDDGAWSYVGTDCKTIPQSEATMNLGWMSLDAYLHEIGHTLGLLHEHQNPQGGIKWNEVQVIQDLSGPPNNWSIDVIRFNVLNPYPPGNVITTSMDAKSIMMYPIPARWTTNGFSTIGGTEISPDDAAFIQSIYPFVAPPVDGSVTLPKSQVDSIVRLVNNMEAYNKRQFQQIRKTLNRK
jgi:hypothetical protein